MSLKLVYAADKMQILDQDIGKDLTGYHVVAGAKTVPFPLEEEQSSSEFVDSRICVFKKIRSVSCLAETGIKTAPEYLLTAPFLIMCRLTRGCRDREYRPGPELTMETGQGSGRVYKIIRA